MMSRLRFIHLVLILVFTTLVSCDKETNHPEIAFKVDGSDIMCNGSENLYGFYYTNQDILSISGHNYILSTNNNQEVVDIKFIIERTDNLNKLLNVEIPLRSDLQNPDSKTNIRGYISKSTHPADYVFKDMSFRITNIKHNRITGTFSGSLVSEHDLSTLTVTEGRFVDLIVEHKAE